MGMSTYVVGFRPPDDKWKAMKKVWDACGAAGVEPPLEVENFFNSVHPDPAGVVVNIASAVKPYNDDSREGYEVDVTKLPKDVTVIRFYNAY